MKNQDPGDATPIPRPSYVCHKLEHRLNEDKDDHQPPRTTTASGTLPWMSRLKRYRRGGYLQKGRSLGRCPGLMDQR